MSSTAAGANTSVPGTGMTWGDRLRTRRRRKPVTGQTRAGRRISLETWEAYHQRERPMTYARMLFERYSSNEDHPRAPAGEPTVVNGKTYQPGEFIPSDEIEAETKSLESKLSALKSLTYRHKLAKAKAAERDHSERASGPIEGDAENSLVDLYAAAGKGPLKSEDVDAALNAHAVQSLNMARLREVALKVDVAAGKLNREDLLKKIRANIVNRAGMHGRVRI